MPRVKVFGLIAIMLIIFTYQTGSAKEVPAVEAQLLEAINQLNLAYNTWEENTYQAAMQPFAKLVEEEPNHFLSHYWQGVAYYNLATFYLYGRPKDKDTQLGQQAINNGIKALKRAIELKADDGESYALLGVLQGMKIQLNVFFAPFQGPVVEKNKEKSLTLNPKNPRVYFLTGISIYMTPQLFGGGLEPALEQMLKAVELFKQEAQLKIEPLQPTWGYSTCLAFIGEIYMKKKQYQDADRYFQKALLVNSNDLKAIEGLELIKKIKQ